MKHLLFGGVLHVGFLLAAPFARHCKLWCGYTEPDMWQPKLRQANTAAITPAFSASRMRAALQSIAPPGGNSDHLLPRSTSKTHCSPAFRADHWAQKRTHETTCSAEVSEAASRKSCIFRIQ